MDLKGGSTEWGECSRQCRVVVNDDDDELAPNLDDPRLRLGLSVNPARIDVVSFHRDQSPTAEVDHTPARSMLKIRPFRFRGPTPGPQLSLGSAWSDE